MSLLTDLLDKAKAIEAEVLKEGTVLVGEAETKIKDLIENLEHEVSKETGKADSPAQTPTTQPTQSDGSGVQTSSDLTA